MAKTIEGGNPGIPAPPDVRAWVHWGDGWAGPLTASRIQGYAPSLLDYVDIAVTSDGHLLTDLSVSTIEIGKVDQGAAGATAWKVDGSGVTQPVSIASMPSTPVTGPLTDTQLRASAVAVSLASLPAVTFASPQHVIVDSATLGTVAVSGSLGRTWALGSGTDAVSVGNFPAGFANTDDVTDRAARLLGHVTVDNASIPAAQSGSWTLSGSDGVSTLPVSARQHNGYTHLYVRDTAAIGVLSELVTELRLLRKERHD